MQVMPTVRHYPLKMNVFRFLLIAIGIIARGNGIIVQVQDTQHHMPLANLTINKSLDKYRMTFCLKFYLLGNLEGHTLFNNNGKRIIGLSVNFKGNYGFGYHGNNNMIFNIPAGAVWPFSWFHLCLACNHNAYHVVVNGKVWNSKQISTNKNDNFDDTLIEKIAIGSKPNGDNVLNGRISDLNIWDHDMSIEELQTMTSSCDELQKQPNVFKWSTVSKNQFSFLNDTAVKFVNDEKGMCSSATHNKLKLIISKLDFEGSRRTCENLNAKLHLPSKIEYENAFNDAQGNAEYKTCLGKLILPLSFDNGTLKNVYSNQPISHIKWRVGEPNGGGLQKCVVMKPDHTISDAFCSTKMFCPICKWNKNPVFLLKGLCPQSKIEHRYVLRIQEVYNGMLIFQGFTNKYYIAFDKNKLTWILVRFLNLNNQTEPIKKENIIGIMTSEDFLPIGLQKWKMNDGICDENMQLKLTPVRIKF